jgi:predicted phosphodiesterase
MIRVIVPDSHGCFIEQEAADAFIEDVRHLDPDEVVMLGDHVDCSAIFSQHPRNYLDDLVYSYEDDVGAADKFITAIEKAAPRAVRHGAIDYLEGNHEQHVERWISRTLQHAKDAEAMRDLLSPDRRLRLKERGIKYYRAAQFHHGLPIRGAIRKGKCVFLHGYRANKYATASHLDDLAVNLVHGHTHRSQSFVKRTISGEIGAWCPGTLAQLQPLYQHTSQSTWSHGYGLQIVDEKTGMFCHVNVPIARGKSVLRTILRTPKIKLR